MDWGVGSHQIAGASGRHWELSFSRLLWPLSSTPDGGDSLVHLVKACVFDPATSRPQRSEPLVVKRQVAFDSAHLEELIDEAAVWRQLGIPTNNTNSDAWPQNVVQLHDVFVMGDHADEQAIVYLMEFCPQGNLPRRGGVLSEPDLVRIALQITDGVDTLIASGADKCHGNIGYDSVLIGADGVAKIAGFGGGRCHARLENPTVDDRDDACMIAKLLFEVAVGRTPGKSKTFPSNISYTKDFTALVEDAMANAFSLRDFRGHLAKLHDPNRASGPAQANAQANAQAQLKPSLTDFLSSTRPSVVDSQREQTHLAPKKSLKDVLSFTQAPMRRDSIATNEASDSTLNNRKNGSLEDFIADATDERSDGIDTNAIEWISAEVNENQTANDVFRNLFKRPISKNPVVAIKALCLIHHLMFAGPPDFWLLTLRQDKFLEWVQGAWSRESVAQGDSGFVGAESFSGGEIAFFSAYLRMKTRFHHRSASAWNGDWSRSSETTEENRDPLDGRQRKILVGMSELFETSEELVARLLQSSDSYTGLRHAMLPTFATDISKCYEAACQMIDSCHSRSQKIKMEQHFDIIHGCTKKALDGIANRPEIASKCQRDSLLRLQHTPPPLLRDEEPPPLPSVGRPPSPVHLGNPPQAQEPQNELVEQQETSRKSKKKKKKQQHSATDLTSSSGDAGAGANGHTETSPPSESRGPEASNIEGEGRDGTGEDMSMALAIPGNVELGDLLNLQPEPEPEQEIIERADPGLTDTDLLAGMLGENAEVAARLNTNYLALPAPGDESDDGAIPERPSYQASRAPIRTNVMEMALIAVDNIRPTDKLHPSFCQCSMCATAEAIQNMCTCEDPQRSDDGERARPQLDLKAKLKSEYEVNPKDVKLGEKIGSGAFGEVFKGRMKNKILAVKVLNPAVLRNKHAVREFKSEIKVLAALEHPNILKFFGACTKPPQFMIITEYAPRGTLFDILYKGQVQLNWVLQKRIAVDICKGMDYLHGSGLLHRDIKSTNLMLDTSFAVKLGDFGLARLTEETNSDGSAEALAGTYQYMAPEVIAREPFTEKADVYAFGMVLWEVMARQLPYYGMDPIDVAQGVLHQGLRPPMPQCPQPIAVLIQACWDAIPSKRPSFSKILEILAPLPG